MQRFFLLLVVIFTLSLHAQPSPEKTLWQSISQNLSSPKIVMGVVVTAMAAYCIVQQDIPLVDITTILSDYFEEPLRNYDLVSQAGRIKYVFSLFPKEELDALLNKLPHSIMHQIPHAPEMAQKIIHEGTESLSSMEIDSLTDAAQNFMSLVKTKQVKIPIWDQISLLAMYLGYERFFQQLEGIFL